jgi:hypothetical protein
MRLNLSASKQWPSLILRVLNVDSQLQFYVIILRVVVASGVSVAACAAGKWEMSERYGQGRSMLPARLLVMLYEESAACRITLSSNICPHL